MYVKFLMKWVTSASRNPVSLQNKSRPHSRGEYNVYSTFQSHEPEFDYLKSLEIEEKINKIRWLPQQNAAHFLLSTNGKNTSFLQKVLIVCYLNIISPMIHLWGFYGVFWGGSHVFSNRVQHLFCL